jgi:serine/threonine protein phosphatase PrpC
MARTMVIGLTESGANAKINEDSFSCGDRVYPDMITGSEEQSLGASDYTQVYIVTQGFGGSGAGDLAGRIIQRVTKDFVAQLDNYKLPELDFYRFSHELIQETHLRVLDQIAPRADQGVGASFALLLIDANTAYILNVGDTKIHLYRDNELYSLIDPYDAQTESDLSIYIGDPRATFELPVPNTMKRFDLETSDIILLATEGFHTNFHHSQLAEDIAAPDAFAANIRLAQLHSRQADNSENGTVLAIKVRDLELVEPDDAAQKNVERIQKSYGSQAPENGTSANVRRRRRNAKDKYPEFGQEPTSSQDVINVQRENNSNGRNGNDYMDTADQVRKSRIKRELKTFGLSLLAGFLIGMAVILVVWFVILK